MPQTSAVTRPAAARTVAAPRLDLADLLSLQIDAFMALEARMRRGARTHGDVDDDEAEAARICAGVRAVFRRPTTQSVNPPRWINADRTSAGW